MMVTVCGYKQHVAVTFLNPLFNFTFILPCRPQAANQAILHQAEVELVGAALRRELLMVAICGYKQYVAITLLNPIFNFAELLLSQALYEKAR
ncbi:hypothetical protein [Pseudoalteromonas peptidolytica]|uniref:hypothetical protein n=1 Tax=Pseudoalteromonas peptidolytica TaxID=61150 RepID=UPI00298E8330|nr:hypothetical protein [Pseudoalteromonas peptidolytica]MDW7549701.1 hypothetical protein [Pseudoalteromonas peptidolytica]